MRRNRCLGYAGLLAIWLLSCSRTELEAVDLPGDDAGNQRAGGGSASIAGSPNGNAPSLGGAGDAAFGGHADGGRGGRAGTAGASHGGGGAGGADALAGDAGTAGQIDMSGPTLYVDPVTGDDRQPGTRAQPLRTIARAASLARAGSEIILLDGVYDGTSQPQFNSPLDSACGLDSGVVIPSGVALRADHSGQARLSIAGYHGLCASGGRIEGLRLERPTPGSRVLECDGGELTIQETTFGNTGFIDSGSTATEAASSALLLSGSAQVTLSPGTLSDFSSGANERFATLTEHASLTITGGALSLSEDPRDSASGFDRGFRVADSASLILHGVLLQRRAASSVQSGTGIALTDSAQVHLDQGTSVTGFARGLYGAQGASRVALDGVDFTDNDCAVLLLSPGDLQRKTVGIRGSRFTRNRQGAFVYAVNIDLTIQDSLFDDNRTIPASTGGVGIEFAASGSASLQNVTITNSEFGLVLARFNSPLDFQISVRDSQVSSNSHVGVSVYAPVDLGSLASPGNNVIQSNGVGQSDGANLLFGSNSPLVDGPVLAVGNTWDADVQGADASGRYTVTGAGARLEVQDGGGPNYRLRPNSIGGLGVRLAENQ